MPSKPLLVQCDFDGTITLGDVSFQILDEYTGSGWRKEFDDYMQGKITVNRFNARAFSRVKASPAELDIFVRRNAVIRPGLNELLDVCREAGFRFVIVSNGMSFYIQTILNMLGLNEIEYIAGKADFLPRGIKAWYPGPDGKPMDNGFKEAWTTYFLNQGYRVIYIGNGTSDFAPARRCSHIFSIDNLTTECQKAGVGHTPFNDLHDVARAIRIIT
jgi:2-hydroxy-3-keto-5-methylthiopentenyl-1-phosphate phosphatase